jgi:hypothetical protein
MTPARGEIANQVDALVAAFLKLGYGEREAVLDEVSMRASTCTALERHTESLVESLAVLDRLCRLCRKELGYRKRSANR